MKKKMFIAGMSLAVALVLLATASFAWYSLSINPETSGMNMALYTDRTLLLAPGDGTDNVPDSDDFKQYISLSDNFAGLASLRPVSTADGVNWYLPSYHTEDGAIGQVSEFILDNTLEHGNISITDASGNKLTGDALLAAQSRGYYVYTDVWMMTEESGANVRLSIPHTYGTTEDRHAGTVVEYGLDSEELQKAVYGTYVLGEPELDESDNTTLKTRTEEPEKALRIGFLVYQDPETLNPVSDGVDDSGIPEEGTELPFKIYEPNADKRAAGTQQELLIPDEDGNTVATRQNYIAGIEASGLLDNTYYVTQPFAKAEDGMPTLTTVSAEDMIVQLASEWDDVSVVKTMNGDWNNTVKRANSNDVSYFGEFLKLNDNFAQPGGTVDLSNTEGMTDIAGSNIIVTLKRDVPVRVRIFIWLEGQDVDCWNDIATGTFRINLELAGETLIRDEEDDVEPGTTICTMKGFGTDGNSSDGWFDSSKAGITRDQITEIEFTDRAPQIYSASWNAGMQKGNKAINAYLVDGKLFIVVPGAVEKISLPNDSSQIFSELYACEEIYGLEYLDTSRVKNMAYMFKNSSGLTSLNLSGFDTSKVSNMGAMFCGCTSLKTLNMSGLDTSSVTTMESMFDNCQCLETLNIASFNTSRVTNMAHMFAGCEALPEIDVSRFDTSKVITMNRMFECCYNITALDLKSFNTSKVENMEAMFYSTNLQTIYVGENWSTASVSHDTDMFLGCTALVGGKGTSYDPGHVDSTYARVDRSGEPGYFTEKNASPRSLTTCTLKGYGSNGNSSDGWFDSTVAGISRNRITELEFTKAAPEDKSKSWNAGTGTGAETITAYAVGTKVYIVIPKDVDTIALPVNSSKLFYCMEKCTSIKGLNLVDTSATTNMSSMFEWCFVLAELDVSGFNTSAVTDANRMFRCTYKLTSLDVSGFDTSSVTNMTRMFDSCGATVLDVSGFDTSNVTDMIYMFWMCDAEALDVSRWNTSRVKDMTAVFGWCEDVKNLDVSNWDISSVTSLSSTFYYCRSLRYLNLGDWDTSKVTDIGGMFNECYNATIEGLENWDTSNIKNMNGAFFRAYTLPCEDIVGWDTSSVTNMSFLFSQNSRIKTLDLSCWDTSSVTDMQHMFSYCSNLKTVYIGSGWDISNVASDKDMFLDCTNLVGGNKTAYDANHIDKTYARIDKEGQPGYFSEKRYVLNRNWYDSSVVGVSKYSVTSLTFATHAPGQYDFNWIAGTDSATGVINAYINGTDVTVVVPKGADKICLPENSSELFKYFGILTTIDGLNLLDTSRVTNMSSMFSDCSGMETLDLSGFDTSAVTNMSDMFLDCFYLTSLNVSGFNTSSVTTMDSMFRRCKRLTSLDVSDFDTAAAKNLGDMFSECSNLTTLDLSSFNTSNVTDMDGMFYMCSSLRTIYAGNGWNTTKVLYGTSLFTSCTNLRGGNGTVFNKTCVSRTYARIDGGTASPGYFTAK